MMKTGIAMTEGMLALQLKEMSISINDERLIGLEEGKTIDPKGKFDDLVELLSDPSVIEAAKRLDATSRKRLDNILLQKLDRDGKTTVFSWVAEHVPDGAKLGLVGLYADRAGEEIIRKGILVPLASHGGFVVQGAARDALLNAFHKEIEDHAMSLELRGSERH
jgi:hypothetical protein